MVADTSSEEKATEDSRDVYISLSCWKKEQQKMSCLSELLYPARKSFRNKGEIFSDTQKWKFYQ